MDATSSPPHTAVLAEELEPPLGGSLEAALRPVLGRSAFQRHLAQLERLGVERCVVQAGRGPEAGRVLEGCREQAAALGLAGLDLELAEPGDPTLAEVSGRTLWLRPDAVYDPRLYAAVAGSPEGTHLAERPVGPSGGEAERPLGLAVGAGNEPPEWGPDTPTLLVEQLPHYLPSLRRVLRPYACATRTAEERERAGARILDATQKGVLDFPARFIHPPLENRATRWLAATPVTPNQITVFTGVIGFVATWLFAREAWGWALAIAFAVNVLDGVDGKLARVKLLASRFGDRLDHTLDVLFEFSWYLGIGWGLSADPPGRPFAMAVGLILVMLGTRGLSGIYKLVTGHQIHDHRPFDRAVRLVAGRRNIYVFFLILGASVGRIGDAFRLCFAWALLTLSVYLARIVVEVARQRGLSPAEPAGGRAP